MLRRLGPAFFLGSVLFVGACKKSEDPAPTTPAPTPTVEPAPPFSLSLLQDAAPSGCTWTRQDTAGIRKALATVDAPCARLGLTWSPDGKHGALVDRGGGEHRPRAWTVDFEAGQGLPLPLPEDGHTDTLGYDAQGHVFALVSQLEGLTRKTERGEEHFVVDGRKLPVPETEGSPGLAHAYRREGEAWKRIETVATVYETDDAVGTGALATASMLVSSTFGADPDAPAATEFSEGSEDTARLDAVVKDKGHTEYGEWVSLETHGGPLYAWRAARELPVLMPPLRWELGDRLVEPESLALGPTSVIELRARGPLLLVASDRAARIYDARAKKRLAALEDVHDARFWPKQRTVTAAIPSSPATAQ
ncbi:hypothetical protein LZ198_27295 [Myxococcus sp. K15C18031901]|uniref:hypothetical protein n=1 Tax=Myxococcus dinghuensis TaxID=2906761 RepID=UPI0020A76B1C|nr:hypothetical protein [Myxococcus dinghuensis]MCP3102585.1 hypothetical protein [Myxococcus dinghuensis]